MRRRDFSRHWALTPRARAFAIRALRVAESLDRIPAPLFAVLLGLLAWAAVRGPWPMVLGLWLFMAGDWLMIALLPRFGRSFAPPQPATLLLALPRAAFALLPISLALPLQVVGTALAFYAMWIEPHRLGVTRERLESPKLRAGRPLRLLHLGDLHVERVTARERELVDRVVALAPDLVLCSGDLLNTSYVRDPVAWEACRWVLERLQAPLGTFLVSGSPPADPEDVVTELVRGLPLRWLRDEAVRIEWEGQSLELIGLSCTHRPFLDRPRLEPLITGPAGLFRVLLYHTPDLAPDAAELGFDLMLSGHTHGGQVRLPLLGAIFTSSLYGKAFEMGRYVQGGLTLYVTRGLGMEGSIAPRVRLLCPPEVVLWEIDGRP